jgi:hypothetical protein
MLKSGQSRDPQPPQPPQSHRIQQALDQRNPRRTLCRLQTIAFLPGLQRYLRLPRRCAPKTFSPQGHNRPFFVVTIAHFQECVIAVLDHAFDVLERPNFVVRVIFGLEKVLAEHLVQHVNRIRLELVDSFENRELHRMAWEFHHILVTHDDVLGQALVGRSTRVAFVWRAYLRALRDSFGDLETSCCCCCCWWYCMSVINQGMWPSGSTYNYLSFQRRLFTIAGSHDFIHRQLTVSLSPADNSACLR